MNGCIRADLHTHTRSSDGTLMPETIAVRAKNSGVNLIAVTDHDTMQSCAKLKEEAKRRGLKSVSGVEVSAYIGEVKMHTLGYGLDAEKFKSFEKKLLDCSLERTEDILKKLRAAGVEITMDDINAQRYSLSAPVHVMNITNVLIKKGYASTGMQVFDRYLAYGKPAFSCILRPSPEEAIEEITRAGGVAVLAHPGRIDMDRDKLALTVKKLKYRGLGGIEVYYTTHTEEKTAYYKRLAESLGLLKTGGSDTHHPTGSRQIGKPVFYADDELLEKLKID